MVQHSLSLRTILLIEPDQNLARIIERALQDHGFVVTQAAAGSEALEILGAQYPDAVVLDPDLSDGAGTAVLDCLRQLEKTEERFPVWVVISALDRTDVARRYGPDIPRFLGKPFDPWDLVRLLEQFL
jgi:DNA-binding response OmpR family regulator